MAGSSIAATLGSGSGIDTVSLVQKLVDAQFAVKSGQLKQREDTLTAQISGAGSLKSAISGFASALNSLVRGGTLTTSPTSANAAVARISTLAGKTVTDLSADLEVVQLAKPQSAASNVIADRTAAIGGGSFTLTFGAATVSNGAMTAFTPGGGTPVNITIAANSSLNDIAAAINAQPLGVTASIVSDNGGARLILKGATGASQGFTLESSDPGLSDLNIGVGATGTSIGSVAQDAIVKLDGVELRRASNSISNLVDNVKLELTGAGTTTLGTAAPAVALGQAVNDIVATYNEVMGVLRAQTDPKGGALRSDSAAQTLQRSLGRLPSLQLVGGNGSTPRTLAEIGVATNRDGTLRVDAARLSKALTDYPAAVEAMFRPDSGNDGIAAALSAISTAATNTATGLGASEARFNSAKTALADAQLKASDEAEKLRSRLTTQFAAMDARVAAYKATQSFLENQVKAWNRDT